MGHKEDPEDDLTEGVNFYLAGFFIDDPFPEGKGI